MLILIFPPLLTWQKDQRMQHYCRLLHNLWHATSKDLRIIIRKSKLRKSEINVNFMAYVVLEILIIKKVN
jgi:hypothetical protein